MPLLEARGLHWIDSSSDAAVDLSIPEGNVYLHGTGQLIDALVAPTEHLRAGTILLRGGAVERALRSGQIAICPSRLPAAETTPLVEALTASAHLMGRGPRDVSRSIEQVGLTSQQRLTLGQLGPEEHRRAGIAHGLLTLPSVLVFSRPFFELTDRGRRDLSRMMRRITGDRTWILAGEASCPVSQDWRAQATTVVAFNDGAWTMSKGEESGGRCFFLQLTKAPAGLTAAFKGRGAGVTPSENPRVLLITDMPYDEIVEVCEQFSEVGVVSLTVAEERGFRNSHARSAL